MIQLELSVTRGNVDFTINIRSSTSLKLFIGLAVILANQKCQR